MQQRDPLTLSDLPTWLEQRTADYIVEAANRPAPPPPAGRFDDVCPNCKGELSSDQINGLASRWNICFDELFFHRSRHPTRQARAWFVGFCPLCGTTIHVDVHLSAAFELFAHADIERVYEYEEARQWLNPNGAGDPVHQAAVAQWREIQRYPLAIDLDAIQ